ncbi:amino acid ABC transporter permease, partial [Campylobacter coli]|nr:amino acid ABC transporter permease [Campylobacter coli]
IKNNSVLLIIGGADHMNSADSYADDYGKYSPSYIFSSILFFIICYPFSFFAKVYEDNLKKAHLKR